MSNVYGDQLRREASSAASSSWNVTIPPTDASVACPADRRSDRATAQPTSPMQIRVIESDRANTNRRTAPSKSSPSCRSTEHRARAFACRQLAGNAVARPASCRSGAHQTDRPATAPSPFQRLLPISCDREAIVCCIGVLGCDHTADRRSCRVPGRQSLRSVTRTRRLHRSKATARCDPAQRRSHKTHAQSAPHGLRENHRPRALACLWLAVRPGCSSRAMTLCKHNEQASQ